MKKIITAKSVIPYILILFTFQNNIVFGQKLYTASVNNIYTNAKLQKSIVAKKVANAFSNINVNTVLNITTTSDESTQVLKNELMPYVKEVQLFNLKNLSVFRSLTANPTGQFSIALPSKYGELMLDLVESDIFANDFKVLTDKNPDGAAIHKGRHYYGVVRGQESVVSASIFDDEVNALISIEGKSSIELVKVLNQENGNNIHAVFDEADLLNQDKLSQICSMPEMSPSFIKSLGDLKNLSTKSLDELPAKCITNFWEAAYNEYLQFGSNTQKVSNFLISLFNKYAAIYTNENISMKLQSTFIWTSSDPYNHTSSLTALNTFSNLRVNFGADLAMLISKKGGGGRAWLDALCDQNEYRRHSFCGSITNAGSNLPTYSWSVNVTTHEVGHNLGSPHTHACVWNGNNTAIDGCGPVYGANYDPPIKYEGNCNEAPIPQKGTIMSYCHLGAAGINLALGFGPQPGNLIRTKVNACIKVFCPPNCIDNISVNIPVNGTAKFEVFHYIIGSSSVTTSTGQAILYDAGKYVQLQPGFLTNTSAGGYFSAYIDGCGGNYIVNPSPVEASAAPGISKTMFEVYPTPFTDKLTIALELADNNKKTSIEVYSITGIKVATLLDENASASGKRNIDWSAHNLPPGTYLIILNTDTKKEVKKIIKM